MSPTSSLPGLYLHIPFCSAVCPYCDFAVRKGSTGQTAPFVEALLREIQGVSHGELQPEAPNLADVIEELVDLPFDSVYLGGGTPTFLNPDQLATVVDCLFRTFRLTSDCVFYLEANPEDVSTESVAGWRDLGFSTLSLGVQSLDDRELDFLGRRHSSKEALQAVEVAKQGGFQTVSVDLIYGLPDQSASSWQKQVNQALLMGVDHLSLYELEIHPRTAFGKRQARGERLQLSETEQAELFLQTHEILGEAGWDTYEVSNFARTAAHRSHHNQKYWRHVPYLGLGPSAHSYVAGWRFWNERLEPQWRSLIEEGISPAAGWEKLPASAVALEMVMLGLRTRAGVDLRRLQPLLQEEFVRANSQLLDSWAEQGLASVAGDHLIPTSLGMAVADRLAAEVVLT